MLPRAACPGGAGGDMRKKKIASGDAELRAQRLDALLEGFPDEARYVIEQLIASYRANQVRNVHRSSFQSSVDKMRNAASKTVVNIHDIGVGNLAMVFAEIYRKRRIRNGDLAAILKPVDPVDVEDCCVCLDAALVILHELVALCDDFAREQRKSGPKTELAQWFVNAVAIIVETVVGPIEWTNKAGTPGALLRDICWCVDPEIGDFTVKAALKSLTDAQKDYGNLPIKHRLAMAELVKRIAAGKYGYAISMPSYEDWSRERRPREESSRGEIE
jgi:hypothetical protein